MQKKHVAKSALLHYININKLRIEISFLTWQRTFVKNLQLTLYLRAKNWVLPPLRSGSKQRYLLSFLFFNFVLEVLMRTYILKNGRENIWIGKEDMRHPWWSCICGNAIRISARLQNIRSVHKYQLHKHISSTQSENEMQEQFHLQ